LRDVLDSFVLVSEQYPKDRSTPQMSSQRSYRRERLHVNPSRMEIELAFKLQEGRIFYQTQVEIPVTTADFYFRTEPRPLIAFVNGRVHLGNTQVVRDEELRSFLRKRGYKVLELCYSGYSVKKERRVVPPTPGLPR